MPQVQSVRDKLPSPKAPSTVLVHSQEGNRPVALQRAPVLRDTAKKHTSDPINSPNHNHHHLLRHARIRHPPSLPHLGNEHEALPYHEGAEDDHGEVEALKKELALVRPELLELEDLLVYHLPDHCFV
jgi:hypothetical protein